MSDLKPLAHSLQPLITSSKKLATISQESAAKAEFVTTRARLLLGQFRKGEANDPATFVRSVAAVLARFTDEIIVAVTDPRTGLASKGDWLPTVREVSEECLRQHGEQRRRWEAIERDRMQLEQRKRAERTREAAPTLEQLRERYGENWGLSAKPARQLNAEAQRKAMERSAVEVGREYEALGASPVYAGDMILSPALVKSIRKDEGA